MLYFVLCISGSLPSQLLYFVFFNQPSQAKGICPLNPLLHISICSTPTAPPGEQPLNTKDLLAACL